MEIVSGRTGSPHVTSQQFRQLVEGTVGQESYILTSGENLEPELASNNILKIRSGMMSHHGNISSIKIGTYDEVELTNGSQGMKRIDLVVNRYTRNAETNVEANNWVVITGTPVASDPAVPAYTVGNLQEGDLTDDCPVFEVHYDGLNITEVKKLLDVADNLGKMKTELAELNGKSGILTSADQNNPITEYQLYKMGKMVVFNVTNYKKGQGAVNGRVIGTIQEGFLPPHTIAISFGTSGAYQFDSSGNPGSRIFVNDAGVVTLYCNKNTGNYISFTACWVTD